MHNGTFTVSADYRNFSYDIAGNADYYGGLLIYNFLKNAGAGLGYHRMDGDSDRLKYHEYRAFVHGKMGKTDVTVDYFLVSYDREVDTVKHSSSASLACGHDFTDSFRIGADLEYSRNPLFHKELKAFLKLIYTFT